MTYPSLATLCLTVLVSAAAATDIRSRRIPNWLTLSGVLLGLLVQAYSSGLAGLKSSGEGMALGFGAYLVLYCLRAMGAGDVKLMAAVGAFVGPENWVFVFVATAFAGALLAIGLMIWKKRVIETLSNCLFIINELIHLRAPHKRRSELDVKDARSLNMPHGVAIAVGTLVCLISAAH